MEIVRNKISLSQLSEMSKNMFGDLVKAVVDIEKEIMAVDAELHADQESLLLFDSMINIRPAHGNTSRGVDDPELQKKIITIVNKLVEK